MDTTFGLELVWKSALILGCAGSTALALRRSTAAARHLVWSLGIAGSLALPLLALAFPAWTWAVLPSRENRPIAPDGGVQTASIGGPRFIPRPVLDRPGESNSGEPIKVAGDTKEGVQTSLTSSVAVFESTSRRLSTNPVGWILGGWAMVAGLMMTVPLMSRLGLKRLVRSARPMEEGEWGALSEGVSAQLGVRRRVTLLRCGSALMPMTCGWLRPIIVLPAEADHWPLERRRDVLLHEMAHVRRFDCLTQAVAQVVCALYWFNPLAWLAAFRMRVERERACDDMVLGAGARPSDYAFLLLDMARGLHSGRSTALAAVSMARPSNLEGRLLAILDPKLSRGELGRPATALAMIALAAVLLPLSALRLRAQQAEPARGGAPVNAPETGIDPTMTVTGRVLDPDGKPVKAAAVDVVGRPRAPWVGASVEEDRHTLLGRGETDGDGRFRIAALRTSATRFFEVKALAAAPGFGLGVAELNPDAVQPAADVRVRPEQTVRVKLVDVSGMPAAGVEVRVESIGRMTDKGLYEGASLSENPPKGIRTWPRPAKTDDQGRFLLTGIDRDSSVSLSVRDLRYARQSFHVEPAGRGTPIDKTVALEPAKIFEGRVLAADTGKPIPNAVVSVTTRVQNEHANGFFTSKFRADGEGRFKINPISGEHYTLGDFPPAGEPYLIQQDELEWVKGAVKMDHDIKLPRGVLIRGKVTENGTGRPLAGSSVQFIPVRGRDNLLSGWQAIVASGDDGSFQIAVAAGKGHLLIFGPTSDYVLDAIGSRVLFDGRPGGQRYYAHKIVAYDVKPDAPAPEVAAALRTGKTIKGRVVGPQGETVTDAFLLTTLRIETFNPSWRGDYHTQIRDGRFELHGLAPEATTRVHFLDPEHQWGASVDISGKQADEDVTVALRPCGRAKARFLGPNGKPVVKHSPHFEFIATPGPSPFTRDKKEQDELGADAAYMPNVDRKNYWNGRFTDAEGRITLPALIPGSRYRITDFSTVNDQAKGPQIRKDFTVEAGETLDLGDILVEKPQP